MLSSVFDANDDIDKMTARFVKKINGCIAVNFRKVRVNNNKKDKTEVLYDKLRNLKGKTDFESLNNINKIKEDIANVEAEKYNYIIKELEAIDDGKMNNQNFWKLTKKLFPKSRDPPAAIFDSKGNILTSNKSIEERTIEVYSERLKGNPIKPNLLGNGKICRQTM